MRSRDLVNSLALPLLLTLAAPANWAQHAVGQAPPEADVAGQPPAVAQQDAERHPVPDAAARLEARQLIEEIFSEDFAAVKKSAKTPAKRSELAKKLLQLARDTEDDPISRFTLLAMSRELATGAADLQTAFAAIVETADVYDLPALPEKAKVLAALAKQPQLPIYRLKVAHAAQTLVDEAMAIDDYALAGQLADLAVASAKKTRNFPFARQVIARKKEVDRLQQEFAAVNEAMEKLAATPDDPAANLAVGHFRCFVKNDWQSGIPMLALGSDKTLKDLANAELEYPGAAEEQLRIADAWWEFGGEQSRRAQHNIQHHAGTWYGKALPQLTGLAKAKAEKRAREAAQPSLAPTSRGLVGHWTFDEARGNRAADSIGQADGRLHGNPTWTQGPLGGALSFDGKDDWVDAGVYPTLPQYTVSAFVNVTATPRQSSSAILLLRSAKDGRQFNFGLYIMHLEAKESSAFSLHFSPRQGGVARTTNRNMMVNAGWHHVAALYDGEEIRLYVDGFLMKRLEGIPPRTDGMQSLLFGAEPEYDNPQGRFWFQGEIDDVRLYNRPLSEEEIAALFSVANS